MTQKLVSFGIPCYNSADYMDHCISSILEGADYADDIEIIVVNDGSTKDDTPAKADEWAERFPTIVKAVHQENGGHGSAVMAGLRNATGTFYKVVDSDDWLDKDALAQLLDVMRASERNGEHVDLFISNYVYDHTFEGTEHAVNYAGILPEGRTFTWHEIGHFRMDQNLLMHSLLYRTEVLRTCGLQLPAHTFYCDNIYAWVPLPHCTTMYYLNVDLYRYFIGREDQSVNESVMAGRIEQQVRITRIMMNAYHVYDDVKIVQLRSYMVNYFVLMMVICSIFSRLSDHEDAMDELERLWADLKAHDRRMWRRCRLGLLGLFSNLPTPLGTKVTISLYRLANKFVKFN